MDGSLQAVQDHSAMPGVVKEGAYVFQIANDCEIVPNGLRVTPVIEAPFAYPKAYISVHDNRNGLVEQLSPTALFNLD